MWITSISPIAVDDDSWGYLGIFLGDIGKRVPWNANPEEMAGRSTHIVGHPWGANVTFDNIKKAQVMSLSTSVTVVIGRRAYATWYRSARGFHKLAEFPAGTVFNPPTNHESLLVFYLTPYHMIAPFHDKKSARMLQDATAMRSVRRELPGDRIEAHVRELSTAVSVAGRMPYGTAPRVLRAEAALAIAKAAGIEAADGSSSESRGHEAQTFCLPMVCNLLAA